MYPEQSQVLKQEEDKNPDYYKEQKEF